MGGSGGTVGLWEIHMRCVSECVGEATWGVRNCNGVQRGWECVHRIWTPSGRRRRDSLGFGVVAGDLPASVVDGDGSFDADRRPAPDPDVGAVVMDRDPTVGADGSALRGDVVGGEELALAHPLG